MAPPYLTPSTATARIPMRRFATQIFFSLLATPIPWLLQRWHILPMSGLIALVCGACSNLALTKSNPRAKFRIRSSQYCIPPSMCLGHLHQITTAIGGRLLESSSGFSQSRQIAVHFCLSFFVISEFEFYRAYINLKNFKPGLDPIKYFLLANVEPDHVFPTSCDPGGFGYMTRTEGQSPKTVVKTNCLHIGQWLLFWIVGGLVNILLKRMIDPSSNGWKGYLCAMTSVNVFFTTENAWTLFLGPPLLRVVRQTNHVGFWAMVAAVEWWKVRAEAHGEAASYTYK